MKDNKNQQRSASTQAEAKAGKPLHQNSQLSNYSHTAVPYGSYETQQPVIRRYAIDDHGGGYQGL